MDIPRLRKERIVNSLQRFVDMPWIKHLASIEYADDGSVKACLFLETDKSNVHSVLVDSLRALNNSQSGISSSVNGDWQERGESVRQENTGCSIGIESSRVLLLDCLLEAIYLAMPSYAPEGQYAETGT